MSHDRKNCNLRKFKMAAILKITLSPYISRELSGFDQIWEADAHFNSHDGHVTKNRNSANSRWRTDAILKIVFGYISAPYCLINATFQSEIQNHMRIQDTWPKLQFSRIQDGGRPSFFKIALSPYLIRELSDFDQIWYTDANFHSEHANLKKKSKLFKLKIADGRHIENRFWLYLGAILFD